MANSYDFLRVSGSDLRVFVPERGGRDGDESKAFYREMESLVSMKEIQRSTVRMESASADIDSNKVASTMRSNSAEQTTGRNV